VCADTISETASPQDQNASPDELESGATDLESTAVHQNGVASPTFVVERRDVTSPGTGGGRGCSYRPTLATPRPCWHRRRLLGKPEV
jgi:hypothetical protein